MGGIPKPIICIYLNIKRVLHTWESGQEEETLFGGGQFIFIYSDNTTLEMFLCYKLTLQALVLGGPHGCFIPFCCFQFNIKKCVRSKVLMAVTMKSTIYCNGAPCSLVVHYINSSKTSVGFYCIMQYHIPEESSLQGSVSIAGSIL